jgi:DNA-binding PadR family transcriptional regulator
MLIKYAILGLLHQKDMYGFQIKNHIEKNFVTMWTVNHSLIYISLKQLVDEACIVPSDAVGFETQGVPYRKLYSLTDKGKKEFKDWLEKLPEEKLLVRDPFMMRFIFFKFGDKDKTLLIIDEQIEAAEKIIARRKKEKPHWETQGLYHFLSQDWGLASTELYLQWLRKARRLMVKSGEVAEQAITVGSLVENHLNFQDARQ